MASGTFWAWVLFESDFEQLNFRGCRSPPFIFLCFVISHFGCAAYAKSTFQVISVWFVCDILTDIWLWHIDSNVTFDWHLFCMKTSALFICWLTSRFCFCESLQTFQCWYFYILYSLVCKKNTTKLFVVLGRRMIFCDFLFGRRGVAYSWDESESSVCKKTTHRTKKECQT